MRLEKVVEVNELLRIYGGLLTRRQFEILSRRYGMDMSFGEIASEFGITRQGVLNFEKKALRRLYLYEKTLGVIKKQEQIKHLLSSIITDANARLALAEMVM